MIFNASRSSILAWFPVMSPERDTAYIKTTNCRVLYRDTAAK